MEEKNEINIDYPDNNDYQPCDCSCCHHNCCNGPHDEEEDGENTDEEE